MTKAAFSHLLIIALFAAGPAWAAPGDSGGASAPPADPTMERASAAIAAQDWPRAQEALRLEPRHRGAHEYIGEAYLMAGNPAKAKEHLGQLDRLCTFGCEEYTKLKKALADYEQKQVKK